MLKVLPIQTKEQQKEICESCGVSFNADLLAYAHGEYYSLGEIVGRFGFSTDKKKKSIAARDAHKDASKATKGGERVAKAGGKAPFYKTVAKRPRAKVKSDKGAPHGKRRPKGTV